MEAEFYAALARERYVLAATGEYLCCDFKERVLVAGLAYRPIKALEIAGRYARYWDDGLADAAGIWTAQNRFSVGVGYTVYERDEISVRPSFEYRYTDFRRGGGARDVAAPDQHEIFGKLSVSYK